MKDNKDAQMVEIDVIGKEYKKLRLKGEVVTLEEGKGNYLNPFNNIETLGCETGVIKDTKVKVGRAVNVKVNINDYVKIKLNETGEEILREYGAKRREQLIKLGVEPTVQAEAVKDAEGYTLMQLWDVMHIFGDKLRTATRVPFDINIIVNVQE